MAVIKCSNCENEILDTDIVCPYCDYPVRGTDNKAGAETAAIEEKSASAVSDATMKVSIGKGALNNENPPKKEAESPKVHTAPKAEKEEVSPEIVSEPTVSDDEPDRTRKVSADDIHSEALRRSLEERRAAREQERRLRKKRKDNKMIIIGVTIVGIFVIIYLLANVISNILGEGIFDKEKENKKAEKVVTSEAQMADLGFKFHSHTLTIVEQSVLMDDYAPDSEKPWKEYSSETSNLTIASGIETISAHAFDDLKNLTHVTIAPTVSAIGDSAFYGCTKLEVIALDSAKSKLASIGNFAFTDCSSLEDVVLGKKIKRIGEGAFKSCDSLKKITIPESVTEIGADAFLGCPDLVIVCDSGSYAYEYATANGIETELTDEEPEVEEEEIITYPSESDSNNTSSQSSSDKSDKSDKDNKKDTKKESSKDTGKDNKKDSEKDSDKSDTSSETSSSNNSTGTTNSDTSSNQPESPSLETLIGDLNTATTQEEKDTILEQIDKVVGGN